MQATVPRQIVRRETQPVLVAEFFGNHHKRLLQIGLPALIKATGGNLRKFGKKFFR
jgi:hypothetical protein